MTQATSVTRSRPAVPDDYLELIMEFPIRPITSAKEHKAAQAILDRLVGRAVEYHDGDGGGVGARGLLLLRERGGGREERGEDDGTTHQFT